MEQMAKIVRHECKICQEKGPAPQNQKELLVPAAASYPMQRLCIDFVGPWPKTKGGYRYILTVLDTFTRWLEAFPTKTNSAEEVVRILVQEVFSRYGLCERIHSDRGTHFTAEKVQELAKELRIPWELGPAYSPKSNNVESHHRVLNGVIGRLTVGEPTKWIEALPIALFIHRTSVCRTTKMAPYSLLFGRDANTSLDLLFRDPAEQLERQEGDPKNIRERIQEAAEWARQNIGKAVIRARKGYRGLRNRYKENDKVWLFTPAIKAGFSKKTAVHWSGPWRVVREINPLFYEISPHPSWLRKKNECVTIDRLKPYVSHKDDDDGFSSQPPPAHMDLSAAGDEFCEDFHGDEEDQEEVPGPIRDLPRIPVGAPAAAPPPAAAGPPQPPGEPEPAPEDEEGDEPAPVRHRRTRMEQLIEDARQIVGPGFGGQRLRRRNNEDAAPEGDEEEEDLEFADPLQSDDDTSSDDSDPEFINFLRKCI